MTSPGAGSYWSPPRATRSSDSDRSSARSLDTLDMTVVSIDPHVPNGVRDVDGRLTAWLAAHDRHAVLVRPDFYVFGSAATAAELPALLQDLAAQLRLTNPVLLQERSR